jgi:lysophospholipase L1-like esterase
LVPPPRVRSVAIELPAGVLDAPEGSLAHFERALDRARRGEGVARVTHFGDSPVTGDLITGEARAYLHRLFGDAGHGFLLPGRPWEWYGHLGVNVEGKGWRIRSPILGQSETLGGLAAVRFTAKGAATVRVDCAKWVRSSVLEIHYLSDPEGGSLTVEVDQQPIGELATRAVERGVAAKRFVLGEDGSHDIGLQTHNDGVVTLLGLVLERQTPGVVYDALGANGAAVFHLAGLDGQHWMDALKLRRPDLVVLAYGTNEAGYYEHPGSAYVKAYRVVVQRIRAALPETSVMIMGPMDRAARQEDGTLATMPSLKRIVAAQHKAARELGCAFFDTYVAMGGEGGALRWYESSPRLMTSDFMHPTRPGAERLARMLVHSLRGDLEARTAAGVDAANIDDGHQSESASRQSR